MRTARRVRRSGKMCRRRCWSWSVSMCRRLEGSLQLVPLRCLEDDVAGAVLVLSCGTLTRLTPLALVLSTPEGVRAYAVVLLQRLDREGAHQFPSVFRSSLPRRQVGLSQVAPGSPRNNKARCRDGNSTQLALLARAQRLVVAEQGQLQTALKRSSSVVSPDGLGCWGSGRRRLGPL